MFSSNVDSSKRNEVAVESPCPPHGAVLVQGMAEMQATEGKHSELEFDPLWDA